MDMNSVTTSGYSISGGFITSIGDIVTSGYTIASGEINITDADARKIAQFVWKENLESTVKAKELMRLFASVLGGYSDRFANQTPRFFSPFDETKIRVQYYTDEQGNRIKQLVMDLDDV